MLFWLFFLLAKMFQDGLEDEDDRNNIFIAGFQERKQVDVTAAGLEGNKMATDLHPCKDKDKRYIFYHKKNYNVICLCSTIIMITICL